MQIYSLSMQSEIKHGMQQAQPVTQHSTAPHIIAVGPTFCLYIGPFVDPQKGHLLFEPC